MWLHKQLDSKKRRWVERHTFWTNCKNPPKITFEKFVKLSGHTCVCNDLTSFEYEVQGMTGNGSYLKMQKLAWRNSWNHFKLTYCWRVLAIWNQCASRRWASRTIISWGLLPQAFLEKIARNALLWQKSSIELIALDLVAQCVISVDLFLTASSTLAVPRNRFRWLFTKYTKLSNIVNFCPKHLWRKSQEMLCFGRNPR